MWRQHWLNVIYRIPHGLNVISPEYATGWCHILMLSMEDRIGRIISTQDSVSWMLSTEDIVCWMLSTEYATAWMLVINDTRLNNIFWI